MASRSILLDSGLFDVCLPFLQGRSSSFMVVHVWSCLTVPVDYHCQDGQSFPGSPYMFCLVVSIAFLLRIFHPMFTVLSSFLALSLPNLRILTILLSSFSCQ